LQGVTIGENKAIKRLRIHHWDKAAEAKWPGIFYVGGSRAETEDDVVIDFDISLEDIESIGKSDSWMKQHGEVQELTQKALRCRREFLQQGIGTVQDLKQQTLWICDVTEANLHNNQQERISEETAATILSCIAQWRESCL
jgi:hypothetical protein